MSIVILFEIKYLYTQLSIFYVYLIDSHLFLYLQTT